MNNTRKILDINLRGMHIICIHRNNPRESNPYRLYHVYWDHGMHRKQLAKYGDFQSILWYINQHHDLFGHD